jgi:hypothetical protein
MIPGLVCAPAILQPAPYVPGTVHEFYSFLGSSVATSFGRYPGYSCRQAIGPSFLSDVGETPHPGRQLRFTLYNEGVFDRLSFSFQDPAAAAYVTKDTPHEITFGGASGMAGGGGYSGDDISGYTVALAVSDWIEVPYFVDTTSGIVIIADVASLGYSDLTDVFFMTHNGSSTAATLYYQSNVDTWNVANPAGVWNNQQKTIALVQKIEIR